MWAGSNVRPTWSGSIWDVGVKKIAPSVNKEGGKSKSSYSDGAHKMEEKSRDEEAKSSARENKQKPSFIDSVEDQALSGVAATHI